MKKRMLNDNERWMVKAMNISEKQRNRVTQSSSFSTASAINLREKHQSWTKNKRKVNKLYKIKINYKLPDWTFKAQLFSS